MSVVISDGIHRPLYVIHHEQPGKRFHPYTGEMMPDDWEMKYNHGTDVTFFQALPGILFVLACFVGIALLIYFLTF